jgi:hypothetical protein
MHQDQTYLVIVALYIISIHVSNSEANLKQKPILPPQSPASITEKRLQNLNPLVRPK